MGWFDKLMPSRIKDGDANALRPGGFVGEVYRLHGAAVTR